MYLEPLHSLELVQSNLIWQTPDDFNDQGASMALLSSQMFFEVSCLLLNGLFQLMGTPGLPTYIGDCSSSGRATLTGGDIILKHIIKFTKLKAKIELQVLK